LRRPVIFEWDWLNYVKLKMVFLVNCVYQQLDLLFYNKPISHHHFLALLLSKIAWHLQCYWIMEYVGSANAILVYGNSTNELNLGWLKNIQYICIKTTENKFLHQTYFCINIVDYLSSLTLYFNQIDAATINLKYLLTNSHRSNTY